MKVISFFSSRIFLFYEILAKISTGVFKNLHMERGRKKSGFESSIRIQPPYKTNHKFHRDLLTVKIHTKESGLGK